MTSSSSGIIATALHKTKSISFNTLNDCTVLNSSMTSTNVLKQLELYQANGLANNNILSFIKENSSIENLDLFYHDTYKQFKGISMLLGTSGTLKALTIRSYGQSLQDIQLIANSLVVNKSVKSFTFCDYKMDQDSATYFLEQAKQACALEELTLGVSGEAYVDYQFLGDVEKCVQQINHIRKMTGISSFLTVEIAHWTYLWFNLALLFVMTAFF